MRRRGGSLRTGASTNVPSWRMLPASEPTLAASATTAIAAPILTPKNRGSVPRESDRLISTLRGKPGSGGSKFIFRREEMNFEPPDP